MAALTDSVSWLYGLQHSGVKLGLDGIRGLLSLLEHPEDAYPSVLVGGTNGKGSTAATLDALLLAHGRRSGLYTSPHLVRPNERIRLLGSDVEDSTLHALLEELRARIAEALAQGALSSHPSFFEVMTAAALQAFRRARLDIAVLEVGLGGRLDATNAVPATVSVIVGVDFDHMTTLGNTLAAIAGEKAGIVKRGRPLISGVTQPEARAVIEGVCRAAAAPLHDAVALTEARPERDGSWTVATRERAYPGLRPALAGDHQIHNLRVALLAFESLAEELGIAVDVDARASRDRRRALARAPPAHRRPAAAPPGWSAQRGRCRRPRARARPAGRTRAGPPLRSHARQGPARDPGSPCPASRRHRPHQVQRVAGGRAPKRSPRRFRQR